MSFPIPTEATHALRVLQECLGHSLQAVYLHGSAVTQGLRPRSDVDILALINQPLSPSARQQLTRGLLDISGHYPVDTAGRRPLEVMLFLHDVPSSTRYPAQCEFLYGEWLRTEITAGVLPEPSQDPEFTLILAQAASAAVALYTADSPTSLPTIHPADIQRAIQELLPTLVASLEGDERNVLLTLARMWYTTSTGKFTAKDHAAEWAAEQLPAEQAQLLHYARDSYQHRVSEQWTNHHHLLNLVVATLSQRIRGLAP